MVAYSVLNQGTIESISRLLGEIGTGSDINTYLAAHNLVDDSGHSTKWRRLNYVFLESQQATKCSMYWSSCAGHFYLTIFILQWAHPIVGCMRPFKIVIMNELRDFLFNSVFIHSRSVA